MSPQKWELKQYIENREQYIANLTTRPHAKLKRRLELIQQQMQMAYDQKKMDALDLLYEMEQQTIAARLIKTENNTPDVPTEMELWREEEDRREAEYDRLEKLNKDRKEALEKFKPVEDELPPAEENEENKEDDKGEEQLKLF